MCQKIGTLHCSGLGENLGGKQVSEGHACGFWGRDSCESSGVLAVGLLLPDPSSPALLLLLNSGSQPF